MPSAKKWNAAGDLDLVAAEEVDSGTGHDGAGREKPEQGDGPLSQEAGHSDPIGCRLALLRHHVRVAIDFEAEGLLDGNRRPRGAARAAAHAGERGVHPRQLREAAGQDRLALLPVERVLAGEGRLYTKEELAEETGLDVEFLNEGARALGVPVRDPGERAITEEELELSRSAKTLLDAGLSEEAFLELTAVMSRSMANIAACSPPSFGEELIQPATPSATSAFATPRRCATWARSRRPPSSRCSTCACASGCARP